MFLVFIISSFCIGWYAKGRKNPFILLGWILLVWMFLALRASLLHR